MFKMNILARPLHKARIYAGSDACNCTKFTHIVTQFVQSLILLQNRCQNPHRLCVRHSVPHHFNGWNMILSLLISVRFLYRNLIRYLVAYLTHCDLIFVSFIVYYTALDYAAKLSLILLLYSVRLIFD